MRRIVVTGAESSGKTTLAQDLAAHYGTVWVHEAARAYLEAKAGFGAAAGYVEEDLLEIARLQLRLEDGFAATIAANAPQVLICDTDLITVRIWGEEVYGRSDPWIVACTEQRAYDLWLLCRPDMPWEPDPLRENPHDRDRLFAVHERMLRALGKPYIIVGGDRGARMRTAVAAIDRMR